MQVFIVNVRSDIRKKKIYYDNQNLRDSQFGILFDTGLFGKTLLICHNYFQKQT